MIGLFGYLYNQNHLVEVGFLMKFSQERKINLNNKRKCGRNVIYSLF